MKALFKEEGHEYRDKAGKKYPSVSYLLERFGYSEIEKVRKFIGDDKMNRSAEFGRVFHHTTVLDDHDKLGSCDQEIEPYLVGWRQFIQDVRPKFISYEESLLSVLGFAGTPDRVEDAGKWLNVPDIKTGVWTRAEEIQTAFYAILVEEHYKRPVKDRYSVHVKPFSYTIVRHKNKNDINIARCILTLLRDQGWRG
jgi:hypothetical protein